MSICVVLLSKTPQIPIPLGSIVVLSLTTDDQTFYIVHYPLFMRNQRAWESSSWVFWLYLLEASAIGAWEPDLLDLVADDELSVENFDWSISGGISDLAVSRFVCGETIELIGSSAFCVASTEFLFVSSMLLRSKGSPDLTRTNQRAITPVSDLVRYLEGWTSAEGGRDSTTCEGDSWDSWTSAGGGRDSTTCEVDSWDSWIESLGSEPGSSFVSSERVLTTGAPEFTRCTQRAIKLASEAVRYLDGSTSAGGRGIPATCGLNSRDSRIESSGADAAAANSASCVNEKKLFSGLDSACPHAVVCGWARSSGDWILLFATKLKGADMSFFLIRLSVKW